MNYEEIEKLSLILTDNLCNQILKKIGHFVIGGWATAAYCGNIRFTADVDIMTMKKCADIKQFLKKCDRISDREYFFNLPKSVISNYSFDLIKFKAISKRIKEIRKLP